jgi:hypothetical protein
MMVEAEVTSETSVNFYQTRRHNNPENSRLHTRSCENLTYHFNPENGGRMFIRNVVVQPKHYAAQQHRTPSVLSWRREPQILGLNRGDIEEVRPISLTAVRHGNARFSK